MAGSVYSVAQLNLSEGTLDLDNPGAAIKAVGLIDNTFSFDESDVDLAAVLTNSGGGGVLTKSAKGSIAVDSTAAMVTTQVTDGVNYVATKTLFTAVGSENAWVVVIIFDATVDTNDNTRIPIAAFPLSITPNGSDIEIRWNNTDGVGIYMQSRNGV